MGEQIGVMKLNKPACMGRIPENLKEKMELLEYNMRDAEVSKKYLQFLFDGFTRLGATPKLTIASTSMSAFRNQFVNKSYFVHPIDILRDEFQGYYGGRTEALKRGWIEGRNYYDVNSLYPWAMCNHMPDPNTLRQSRNNDLGLIRQYEGMSLVDIQLDDHERQIPLLPYRTPDKLIFPTGSVKNVWHTHLELNKALSLGYKITKVHKTYYYRDTCRPFDGYVKKFYDVKKNAKKDSPERAVAKLMLNSLYGKFGQKFDMRDNYIPKNIPHDELMKYDYIEPVGDFYMVKENCEPPPFCFPIWASYITSYARLKLFDLMTQCDPEYLDTDSIVTTKKMPTGDELGELKLEMRVKHGIIVRPKMYAFVDDNDNEYVKVKGLGTRIGYTDFETLMISPEKHYEKFVRFKEAMRRGLSVNEIMQTVKRFSLEDKKREWLGSFNPRCLQGSLPLRLTAGMTKEELDTQKEKALKKALLNRKLNEEMLRKRRVEIIASEYFDRYAVGDDISYEEYLDNEMNSYKYE